MLVISINGRFEETAQPPIKTSKHTTPIVGPVRREIMMRDYLRFGKSCKSRNPAYLDSGIEKTSECVMASRV